MAVKKKPTNQKLPTELERLLDQGFRYGVVQRAYKDLYDRQRKEIQRYLETTDEIEVVPGKSIKATGGSVLYTESVGYRIDPDEIAKLVCEGLLTVETLAHLAFPDGKMQSADKIKAALGEDRFNAITRTVTETTYVKLSANGGTKNRIYEEFALDLLPEVAEDDQATKDLAQRQAELPAEAPKSLEKILI